MAARIHKFIAKTVEDIENYINMLPVDVYILGAPQQIVVKNKTLWVVWFMPYGSNDSQFIGKK